jgi:hypothetical protein
MIIKTYSSLTRQELEKFYKFCQTVGTISTEPAAKNMWGIENNTVPYLLNTTERFKNPNGEFFVLFDRDIVVACSGVYKSSFENTIGIAGVRTFVIDECRHLSLNREYFLVEQKKWCIDNGLKIIMLTFNDYNKNLINVFKRRRLGEKSDRCNTREPKHLFYNNFNEVQFPLTIQYTKQWAIYEKLDINFSFDWDSIKWK